MMPPLTGDPYHDGFNIGYAIGVLLGAGGMTLLFMVLLLLDVFA